MVGINYGQSRQEASSFDKTDTTISQIKKQEAAVATVTYNLNKFTQFIAEYSYAQNTWHDDATQHSNQVSLGTMFYW
jgi:predicted porin